MAPFFGQSMPPNPEVFFDIAINGQSPCRIKMELYADVVPVTVKNFQALCNGERIGRTGNPLHYKGSAFHCGSQWVMCQGGDFTVGNGTGEESIHGGIFGDEKFIRGCLSMPKDGPGSNGSQFFILTAKTDELVGKHFVFGRIVDGMDVVRRLEEAGKKSRRKSGSIPMAVVLSCGDL